MFRKSTALAENDRENQRGNPRCRMHHNAARKIFHPHVLQPAAPPNPMSHGRVNHRQPQGGEKHDRPEFHPLDHRPDI